MKYFPWKIKLFIFLGICTFHQSICQIDNYRFERISESHDMLHGRIMEIIEDHQGYIWFATQEGVFRYDGYEFKAFRHDVTDSTSLSHPFSRCLIQDSAHNIWVGTTYGLNLYTPEDDSFKRFLPFPELGTKSKVGNLVRELEEDQNGKIWLATNGGIVGFDQVSQSFIYPKNQTNQHIGSVWSIYADDKNTIWASTSNGILKMEEGIILELYSVTNPSAPESIPYDLAEGPEKAIWISTNAGMYEWNPNSNTTSELIVLEPFSSSRFTSFAKDDTGNYWVGTSDGLVQFSVQQNTSQVFRHDQNHEHSLIQNAVSSVIIDRFNILWIGTINGVCKLDLSNNEFHFLQNKPGTEHSSNRVLRIHKDVNGDIWTKTADGLYKIEKGTQRGEKISILRNGPESYLVDCIVEDKFDRLWVAIRGYGLFVKSKNSDLFSPYETKAGLERLSIYKAEPDLDEPEILWLGTNNGFGKFNTTTREVDWFIPSDQIEDLPNNRMIIFQQGNNNKIWLYYTFHNRLGSFDKKSSKFELFEPSVSQTSYLEGDIHDLEIDVNGNLWIASLYGLTLFDTKTKNFSILTKKDGLPESELNIVIQDEDEKLWICGYQFISQYDPDKKLFVNHYPAPKVKSFYSRSSTKGKDGQIYLGGKNGIYGFNPRKLKKNSAPPNIVLNDFKVSNESYENTRFNDPDFTAKLKHNQNDISFEFAGLHYINPKANTYKSRLIGYDKDWQSLETDRKVSYTNLDPGDYQFQLHAANSDGYWTEEPYLFNFQIRPAFWETNWFRTLLFLLFAVIAFIIIRNRRHQQYLKREKELAERTAEYKMNFLANVSHEIRTPMTSIKAIAELINETSLDHKQQEYIGAIQKSSTHLVKIVNELLDYSKIEADKFTLRINRFNIRDLLNEVESMLKHHEQAKGIQISHHIARDVPSYLEGDELRLYQVLINLMGNAIKFTDEGSVELYVSLLESNPENVNILFEIKDTGVGIPAEKLGNIFEDYTQAYEANSKKYKGTGLGLSISKKLIERQGGELKIESNLGSGTNVYFNLPLKVAQSAEDQNRAWTPPDLGSLDILIAEDNALNAMLITELIHKSAPDCKITLVENGASAVSACQEKTFDVVLMDVKMPVMNGIEATKAIRASIDSLPIIGLTANISEDQRTKCIKVGMNDCVFKPIDSKELLTKIDELTRTVENA